jgi:hypothetical protein
MKRRLRHRKRGYFAMHQGRYLLAHVNRRLTGGVGRVCSQRANPVYPREDKQDSDRRRGRNEPQQADFP